MDNGAASYRRFIDGDQEAFGEIVDLYRENLIFFILFSLDFHDFHDSHGSHQSQEHRKKEVSSD